MESTAKTTSDSSTHTRHSSRGVATRVPSTACVKNRSPSYSEVAPTHRRASRMTSRSPTSSSSSSPSKKSLTADRNRMPANNKVVQRNLRTAATPATIITPRMPTAPTMPQPSTRCWWSLGTWAGGVLSGSSRVRSAAASLDARRGAPASARRPRFEVVEEHDENKEVVDAQRLLHEVARGEGRGRRPPAPGPQQRAERARREDRVRGAPHRPAEFVVRRRRPEHIVG
mmetsp:Transcript_14513/g.43336  ORF Transcript_14513/g.43336 Transcript_14513/m.43336 type:complete len:228 (+) Transcript_14513:421-1104(+)